MKYIQSKEELMASTEIITPGNYSHVQLFDQELDGKLRLSEVKGEVLPPSDITDNIDFRYSFSGQKVTDFPDYEEKDKEKWDKITLIQIPVRNSKDVKYNEYRYSKQKLEVSRHILDIHNIRLYYAMGLKGFKAYTSSETSDAFGDLLGEL